MKIGHIVSGLGGISLMAIIVISCSDSGEGRGGGSGGGGKGGGGGEQGGNAGKGGGGGSAGGKGGKGGKGGTGGVSTGGTAGGNAGAGGSAGAAGGMAGSAGGAAGAMGGQGGSMVVDAGVDAPVVDSSTTPQDAGGDALALPLNVLAYEPFGAVGRLHRSAAGGGWLSPWEVNSDDITMNGYQVLDTAPLTYMTLKSTPSYASGGQLYRESGRRFDAAAEGTFKDFLKSPAIIGAAGKTLWFSFLLRRGETGDNDTRVSFHSSNAAFWDGDLGAPATFAFGLFGDGSKTDDKRYWSLRLRNTDTAIKTTVEAALGQTVFVVMSVAFTEVGGTVKLYLNPTSLGAAAPATPTAEATSTMVLDFKSFAFYPGNSPGNAAIDEIRAGTSYASVTPVN